MFSEDCCPETLERVPFDAPAAWERSKLTVCIAAVCNNAFSGGNIVLCSDRKAGSELGSTETHYKQRFLADNWQCMGAGPESEVLALYTHLRNEFSSATKIDETNVLRLIESALKTRKREKSNQYTSAKFGMSYDEFVEIGKAKLPDELFRAAMLDISGLSTRAEFVICGP